MDTNTVTTKIKEVINDLDILVDYFNQEGAQKFSISDHTKAKEILEKVEKLVKARMKIVDAYQELSGMESTKDRSDKQIKTQPAIEDIFENKTKSKQTTKSQGNGKKKTHEEKFYDPILIALESLGGSAYSYQVIDIVHDLLRDEFNEIDYQGMPSNPKEIRWVNTARWARQTLKNEGLLKKNSPHGVWELDKAGWNHLKKNKEGENNPSFPDIPKLWE